MDEIAPEYDVIVLGTGTFLFPLLACFCHHKADPRINESFGLMPPIYCIPKRMLTAFRID